MYRTVPSRAQGFHGVLACVRFAVAWLHSRLWFPSEDRLGIGLLAAVIVLLEFVRYRQFLDPLSQSGLHTMCMPWERPLVRPSDG